MSRPSSGGGQTRSSGLDVVSANSRKPAEVKPSTPMTRARSDDGRARPNAADRAAAQRQDQAPQQDGALVVPPGAGDLVDQRLQAVGVLHDVGDREVVHHRAPDQAAIGGRQRDELADGQRRRRLHQPGVARVGAQQRQHRLRAGEDHGQRQGEMAEFGDHPPACVLASVFQVAAGRRRAGRPDSSGPTSSARRPRPSACRSRRASPAPRRRGTCRPAAARRGSPRPDPRGTGPAGCRHRSPRRWPRHR